jgi:hypothetical protein
LTGAPVALTGPLPPHGGQSRLAWALPRLLGWTVMCWLGCRQRIVRLTRFVQLTGNVEAKFAACADNLGSRVDKRFAPARPIRPLL